MKTVVVAPKGTPYDPPGSMLWDNCLEGNPPELHFGNEWELWMALHDDLLNQDPLRGVLGRTPRDLHRRVGARRGWPRHGRPADPGRPLDLAVTVSAMLPPVITSCNAWDDILIQMGDVRVDASFGMLGLDVALTLYASLELTGGIELVDTDLGNELTIVVEGVSFVEIEIAELNDALLGNEAAIGDLLEGFLLPMALDAIVGQTFGFALPTIDVGSLAPDLGLPPNLQLGLDIQSFEVGLGYTILGVRRAGAELMNALGMGRSRPRARTIG
ncbi:MAG: hypothetical protein M5U09_18870 [Gammaproteobacteria bacterium]|nr:hypothetical protein [Gammaproteobacteria bacterium]